MTHNEQCQYQDQTVPESIPCHLRPKVVNARGNDMALAQQVVVAITALLASIGAAGIPHAGTVMMVVVLSAVGLPIEYVGLILAVDRILDMYRTSVNVWSDSTACAVVARFEPKES